MSHRGRAPWEYSLHWAHWLAHSQIERAGLRFTLTLKGKLPPPGGQPCSLTPSSFISHKLSLLANESILMLHHIPSCLRLGWGKYSATSLIYRMEFHPLGPQFHFCTIPALPNPIWTIKKLNFMILFRPCMFGLASKRAVRLGLF